MEASAGHHARLLVVEGAGPPPCACSPGCEDARQLRACLCCLGGIGPLLLRTALMAQAAGERRAPTACPRLVINRGAVGLLRNCRPGEGGGHWCPRPLCTTARRVGGGGEGGDRGVPQWRER